MSKYIIGLSFLFMSSFSAFAGGGETWIPSVSASQCVVPTDAQPVGGWKWRDSSACNDVISHGYAEGLGISGLVVYDGGQDTVGYSGFVRPNQSYTIQAPATYNGKKYKGLTRGDIYWLK